MPCKPEDFSIGQGAFPGVPIPGFGLPFSPIQLPLPDWDLPTDVIEDILRLIQQLQANFPLGMIFKALPNISLRNVLDAIANILGQIMPFLSLYNFFMAALQIIICIIEVLCAIPNPFALIAKLKKLFAECIPNFLSIFPWMALIAMIIALLLLILALITYIIEQILAIIEELIKNLIAFGKSLTLQDAESTLAIAQKIAALLCSIQNLMAIFVAIAAIMAIIQSLALFAGSGICADEDSGGDDEGCCSTALCPPFIKNNANGISTTDGKLIYYNQINTDVEGIFGIPGIANSFNLPALRMERWQLFDTAITQQYPIASIITPIGNSALPVSGQIFFPDQEFSSTTPASRSPYTVDMRMLLDPVIFNSNDTGGARYLRVNNCIVVRKPYIGVLNYENTIENTNVTGTLNIEGGLVFEDDNATPYMVNGAQATLNTFMHSPSLLGNLPSSDDGYSINNVEFTWKPQHGALVSFNLISIGCVPEVSVEKAVQNSKILAEGGFGSVFSKLQFVPDGELVPSTGILPNVLGTVQCVQNAIDKLKQNITVEAAGEFSATVNTCLNDLKAQTEFAYCGALKEGVSQFQSTVAIDTDAQFTTRPIKVSVVLKDANGSIISSNIPESCSSDMEDLLKGEVTLGSIGKFEYDGYSEFNANITSDETGVGTLTISFNEKIFSKIITGETYGTNSQIIENTVDYTFVSTVSQPMVSRDETDVAGGET